MQISIIIPVLNESDAISTVAENLSSGKGDYEVIVVDGGSVDDTVEKARRCGFNVIKSSKTGRAFQMNEGALIAKGEILFFMHADSILPACWQRRIIDSLSDDKVTACCFDIDFNTTSRLMKLIAKAANFRSRITGIPYGDQGVGIRAETFKKIGGFPEISFLEDVVFFKKVKKHRGILFINNPLVTSERRWINNGIIKTTLLNWFIIALFLLGFAPDSLKRFYK